MRRTSQQDGDLSPARPVAAELSRIEGELHDLEFPRRSLGGPGAEEMLLRPAASDSPPVTEMLLRPLATDPEREQS